MRSCRKAYNKQWYLDHKEYKKQRVKQYNLDNKEHLKQYVKQYNLDNKEHKKQYKKQWRLDHKEEIKQYNKQWCLDHKEYHKQYYLDHKEHRKELSKQHYLDNKEHRNQCSKQYRLNHKEQRNQHQREKRKNNPNFKILLNLRCRQYHALKGKNKSASTIELLGCTPKELWDHLMSCDTLEHWMTKENYGVWHVDHIMPCASFDLTDPQQQRQCFYHTNLQPLSATANLIKGSKII